MTCNQWSDFQLYAGKPFFEMPGRFSLSNVATLHRKAYKKFYFSPRQFFKHLIDQDKWSNILSKAKAMVEWLKN